MSTWLKKAFLGLCLLTLIWAVVVLNWFWREHQPSSTEVVLGLLVLPVLLLSGYGLLKRVFGSLLEPNAAGSDPVAANGLASASDESQVTTPPVRMWLGVLAASTRMSAGGATELLQACTEGIRPPLDERLRDGDGFPVAAARVQELDGMDAVEWWDSMGLAEAVPLGRDWVANLPGSRVRELRLLADVLAESAIGLERHLVQSQASKGKVAAPLTASFTPSGDARPRTSEGSDASWPCVRVALLWDTAWAPEDAAMLAVCVQAWLTQNAPALRFSVQPQSMDGDSEINLPASRSGLPWPDALFAVPPEPDLTLGQTVGDTSKVPAELWLLASARSLVDQAEIDALAASGKLHGPRRREGLIAGEGAAALALVRAHPQHPPGFVVVDEVPVLAGMALAPAPQNKPGDFLGALAQSVIKDCGEAPTVVGKVLSDADHRPGPVLELGMLQSQHFPELEMLQDCVLLGQPSGHTGGVAALASLVLAAEQAASEPCGALVLALAGKRWRGAALVMPPGWTRPKPDTAT